MLRRKQKKQTRPAQLLVPRLAIVEALARASYDGNQQAIASARRLLDLCDERGHDSLVF